MYNRYPPHGSQFQWTANWYAIRGLRIDVALWEQQQDGKDDIRSVQLGGAGLPDPLDYPFQFATVDRASYERHHMWSRKWQRCFDHLTQRHWPCYEDALRDHPPLFQAWKARQQQLDDSPRDAPHAAKTDCPIVFGFPFLTDSVYRPMHTLFYYDDSLAQPWPDIFYNAHRVVVRHIDANTFNNFAPDLVDLIAAHLKTADGVVSVKSGNLQCTLFPDGSLTRIDNRFTLRLPLVTLNSKRGVKWTLRKPDGTHHTMETKDGVDARVLLLHYAMLIPTYATRSSSDETAKEKVGARTRLNTKVVFAPPSVARIFTPSSPPFEFKEDNSDSSDSERKRRKTEMKTSHVALSYATTCEQVWSLLESVKTKKQDGICTYCYDDDGPDPDVEGGDTGEGTGVK
jgi:hypothetical protein